MAYVAFCAYMVSYCIFVVMCSTGAQIYLYMVTATTLLYLGVILEQRTWSLDLVYIDLMACVNVNVLANWLFYATVSNE